MKVDHVGIVVHDIQAALAVYEHALGLALAEVVDVPDQEVKIAFLPVGDSNVELVQPTTDDSGIARYLAKRGEGIHHICLEVDDIQAMLERLKAHGIQLVHDEPAVAENGKKYAFIHPKAAFGVMVELYELPVE